MFVSVEAGKDGSPSMSIDIRAEQLIDFLRFNAAIRRQTRRKTTTDKNSAPGDGRVEFDITPSLHDTDLGLVVLARWDFRGFHGAQHLPDTGILGTGVTVYDPFCVNDWRQLAWLAKFETLSASMVFNGADISLATREVTHKYGQDSLSELNHCSNFGSSDMGDEDGDEESAPVPWGFEFEMFRRRADTPQFVRRAWEAMRRIGVEKPKDWYGPGFAPGESALSRHRYWDAAVCAYNTPNGNILR